MENGHDAGSDVGYDDYESDFDLGGEIETDGGIPDTVESELDAVADLLSGDSEKADALAAQREKTGATSKVSRQSINLDSHGHKVFHESSAAPEPKAEAEAPTTIYSQQVLENGAHAASEFQAAHAENERLNDLFASGQLSAEDHYRLTFEQGQRCAAAKELMYQTRIQELEHGAQKEAQLKALETQLGADFAPEKAITTMHDMVAFARKNGISDDVLRGVETVEEAGFIYNAMKNQNELQRAQLELKAAKQMLKKQNAQLKGRQRKQSKDASIGKRNADAIDQVADLLSQHGISGGRR